jgi:NAD(P)-dependent dehydrogenase (short-subunit alcohol dehydrogenase family)
LTGASTGIGAATVRLLVQHGASVVFGDINTDFETAGEPSSSSVTFVECDVTKHNDLYQLFKQAHDKHGHIDHAIACAGIFEHGNWFDPNHTIESIKGDPGNTKTLDVNLMGTLHFSRIAAVFLRGARTTESSNRSLTFLSSVNAFRDSPGLHLYQTSKHAVQGLMRSCRKTLYERDGIRVNAVCPGVTDTPMSAHIMQPFKDAGLFWQSAEAVAGVIAGILTSSGMNGKAFYVEGGDAFEFEDGLYETQSQWLGEEATRRLRTNTEAVERGVLLPK